MYANYKYLAGVRTIILLSSASDIAREILRKSQKYAKHYQIHVGTTCLILILAIGPILFTLNVQIYLETLLLQQANNVPKLPSLHLMLQKNWVLAMVLLLLKEQMIRVI